MPREPPWIVKLPDPSAPEALRLSCPAERVIPPESVLFPARVKVPAVVLLMEAEPARIAETVPFWSVREDAVRIPVDPVIEPPVRVSAPMVSLLDPKESVPPFTVTAPAFARVLVACPRTSVPAFTVMPPVYSLKALRVSVPDPFFVRAPRARLALEISQFTLRLAFAPTSKTRLASPSLM